VQLLEGNEEAAIDEIRGALKNNTKTVEAYFALGTMFRSRKEHERAVRVHQALLLRRDLDRKTRLRVHLQLAQDFRAAGFERRAARALEYVVVQDKKNGPALRQLAESYQRTGQWERAALSYGRLKKLTQENTDSLVCHLYAQLAEDSLRAGDLTQARKSLRKAIEIDSEATHALDVLGDYQRRRGNNDAAAKAYRKAVTRAPDLASYFFPKLEVVLFELERMSELDLLLDELTQMQPDNPHVRLAHARFDAKRNPRRALQALTGLLDSYPRLMPARREAGRLLLEQGDTVAIRFAFEEMLQVLGAADRSYRCGSCQSARSELFWCCPTCGTWDSVRAAWGRRAGEGEVQEKKRGHDA
jgi:lipopolysaccharide biosynthesis regulator YciM